MEQIEFATEVKIGGKNIDRIAVKPLPFVALVQLWEKASNAPGKYEVEMQRLRIQHQAHFMAASERVIPDLSDLAKLPLPVAKAIIGALDKGNGKLGSILSDGDGMATPVHLKLGTPIEMKDAKGEVVKIEELEFSAKTYGEVEDILAADGELNKALALLRTLAAPVGSSLSRLPGWALDQITSADGLTVMRKVCPRF